MGDWFAREIVDEGKLPAFVLFVAYIATFLGTRTVTRLIRAGRGPFRDNVSGGVHIHHAVPGLLLLIGGGLMSVTTGAAQPWAEIAAGVIGTGTALVLDEFALILHLEDVYWSQEGRLSVHLVALAGAAMALVLLGITPLDPGGFALAPATLVPLGIHLTAVAVCVDKGKYPTAFLGAFVPPVAWTGAIRLARPETRWARRHYGPKREARARRRADGIDARFGQFGGWVADLVAGKASAGTPPSQAPGSSAS